MSKIDVIDKYKKDRHIRDDYKLDEDEEYLTDRIKELEDYVKLLESDLITSVLFDDKMMRDYLEMRIEVLNLKPS